MADAKREAWEVVENIEKIRGAGAPGAIIRSTPLIDKEVTRGNSIFSSESALGQASDTYRNWGKPALGTLPMSFKKGVGATNITTKDQVSPVTEPVTEKTGAQEGSPQTPTTDIYDRISKLSDRDFKTFVDERHNIPGVGYIGDANAKFDETGTFMPSGKKSKFIKSIEDPTKKYVAPEQLNVAEKTARITAEAHAAGVGEARADRKTIADEKASQKTYTDFIKLHGVSRPDETGKPALDEPQTIWKARELGIKVPEQLAQTQALLEGNYKDFWATQFTDGKGNVVPEKVAAYKKDPKGITKTINKLFGETLKPRT